MSKFEIFDAVKPYKLNQEWGVYDPRYERFGFKYHNGKDLGLVIGQPIYASQQARITKIGWQPEGAGLYICLVTDKDYQFDDGVTASVEITYMHLSQTKVKVGDVIKVGELIALGGNTGFSTGPHTHEACKRVKQFSGYYTEIDKNEAKNTFNQEPYRNKIYAVDVRQKINSLEAIIQWLKGRLGLK